MKKIQMYWGEKWETIEEFTLKGTVYYPKHEYKVSNLGRVSKKESEDEEPVLLKKYNINKYEVVVLQSTIGKNHNFYIHRLLGLYFLKKPSEDCIIVTHKNYDITDNKLKNLVWMTKSQHSKHTTKSPAFIEAHKRKTNYKLTAERVSLIKRIIFDPNRKTRMRVIAKQFGISEMQLYRIKSGENWGDVKPLD